MISMSIVLLFLVECFQFSAAYFITKKSSLRTQAGGSPLAHLLDDLEEKIKLKSLQNRTTVLQGEAASSLAPALRLDPAYFKKLVSYFQYLDSNSDKSLSELEFMEVRHWDEELREKGRQAYALFSGADGKPGMTLQEFVRLVVVVTKVPGGFEFTADDLKAMPSKTVADDQDRDNLMRLFVVFDENSSGDVPKAEFEHAWMGPTLWKLRNEGMLTERWMASTAEFDHAKGEFTTYAGSNGVLSLAEFASLLEDSVKHRDDHYAKTRDQPGPKKVIGPDGRMIGSSHSMATVTAFLITFTFLARDWS